MSAERPAHSVTVHERLTGKHSALCRCGKWIGPYPTPQEAKTAGDEHVREETGKP